mgnify:CR=1 FL=1
MDSACIGGFRAYSIWLVCTIAYLSVHLVACLGVSLCVFVNSLILECLRAFVC